MKARTCEHESTVALPRCDHAFCQTHGEIAVEGLGGVGRLRQKGLTGARVTTKDHSLATVSTITVVALTTATAILPGTSFNSRAASVLIRDTTV